MREVIEKVLAAEAEGSRLLAEARGRAAAILSAAKKRAAELTAAAAAAAGLAAGESAAAALAAAAREKEELLAAERVKIETETRLDAAALSRAAGVAVRRVLGT